METEEFKKPETINPMKPQPVPIQHAELPISAPSWLTDCPSNMNYYLEVLKDGCVLDNVNLASRRSLLIGRLDTCDLPLLHPSLSRKHAILMYSSGNSDKSTLEDQPPPSSEENNEKEDDTQAAVLPRGWYLYDLGSTHGTQVNKARISSNFFHRVRVGYILKFAGSSRLFLLQGPEEDQEPEANMTWTEIKERYEARKAKLDRATLRDEEGTFEQPIEVAKETEEGTCLWGMAEDAVEVTEENPFALLDAGLHEEAYKEAPQKTLKLYFEREGLDMPQFTFEEAGFGRQHCRFELPLDNAATGGPMFAEVIVSGKRREAIEACALEACRILDQMGELNKENGVARISHHQLKSQRLEENEYYSSDEDTFLDRTGIIEKKRQQRMQRAGKIAVASQEPETYNSLMEKLTNVETEIGEIEGKLEKARSDLAVQKKASEVDELEAYLEAIKSGAMDRATRMRLKVQLIELRKEQARLQKLANIAKPKESAFLKKLTAPGPVAPPIDLKVIKQELVKENLKQRNIRVHLEKRTFHTKVMEDEDEEENTKTSKHQEEVSSDVTEILTSSTPHIQEVVETKPEKKSSTVTDTVAVAAATADETYSPVVKSERIFGPTMPDNWRELLPVTDQKEEATKRQPTSTEPSRQMPIKRPKREDPDEWLPPQNQSGDGSTRLNKKFGY